MKIIGKVFLVFCISGIFAGLQINAQDITSTLINKNKPEREEWLKDAGFGMFIHWNVDVQLGTVISHTLVGSSEEYADKYIKELPATFKPVDWNPEKIVILAKNAGMRYIVFTTKHHSGFCFWDTKTTDFNITNTPYGKDLLAEFVETCRKYGMSVGFYFSTEDFVYSYRNGIKDIRRRKHWEHAEPIREKYEQYLQDQTWELMAEFGEVDIFFIDSEAYREEVKKMVWEMQPNCVITRGAILTPEQFIPGETINVAWESNMTMGTQWNYKPTNEHYKSGNYLINALIHARAQGGSFLLNIGPDQWGNLNEAQQGRLMELAAWNFVNGEAIQDVRPWIVRNEGDIWLARHKADNTVYAYITGIENWARGDRKSFLLKSVRATDATKISVLGQTGNVVEYMPDTDGKAYYIQADEGLNISVVRAQRIYNNHKWPNPIVVKLENVEAAVEPVKFATLEAEISGENTVTFRSEIRELGSGSDLSLSFEYRPRVSSLDKKGEQPWQRSMTKEIYQTGDYLMEVTDELFRSMKREDALNNQVTASDAPSGIEYRAVLIQDGLEIQGNILTMD
jgi:alpha-L-fucosidase